MSSDQPRFPEIPGELRARLQNLTPWLTTTGDAAWSENDVLLHVLERGLHDLECKYWRIRSDDELREDFAWLVDEHRHWLLAFADVHTDRWNRSLRVQPESALWEAVARRVLDEFFLDLHPGESATAVGEGPDFMCEGVPGLSMAIDAKCLRIETATKRTALHDDCSQGSFFGQATVSLARSAKKAIPQARPAKDLPFFVCLGTLHRVAGIHCLEQRAAEELMRYGISRLFPSQADADSEEARAARTTSVLTGVLLVGSRAVTREIRHSTASPCIRGVLNPSAANPVPTSALRGIPIARIENDRIDWPPEDP